MTSNKSNDRGVVVTEDELCLIERGVLVLFLYYLRYLFFLSSFLCFFDFLVHLLLDSVIKFLYFFVALFLTFHGIDGSHRHIFDFGSLYLVGSPVFYLKLTGFFVDGDLSIYPIDNWLVFLEPWKSKDDIVGSYSGDKELF